MRGKLEPEDYKQSDGNKIRHPVSMYRNIGDNVQKNGLILVGIVYCVKGMNVITYKYKERRSTI